MIVANVFKAIDYVFNSFVQIISDSLDDLGYAVKKICQRSFDTEKINRTAEGSMAIMGKPWYENMRLDVLAGIHVRVNLKNGNLIVGKLINDNTGLPYIIIDDKHINILDYRSKPGVGFCLQKSDSVESVDYLWDEKDYEQIGCENIREGDYIVSNGVLMMVDSMDEGHTTIKVNMKDDLPDIEIPKELVSTVLRYKQILPYDSGTYKADHCLYLILDSRKQWIVVLNDYTVNTYEYDDLPVIYRDNIRK